MNFPVMALSKHYWIRIQYCTFVIPPPREKLKARDILTNLLTNKETGVAKTEKKILERKKMMTSKIEKTIHAS